MVNSSQIHLSILESPYTSLSPRLDCPFPSVWSSSVPRWK